MFFAVLWIVLGLALLVAGGELLVRSATRIAQFLRVSPSVIGLTVVAAGTSMPEMVVSIQAAVSGNTALSVGNVVGSNIFNIGAILGIAALIAPLRIHSNTVRMEWPVMFLATGLLHLLARDGTLDRLEGGFFVVGFVLFTVFVIRIARHDLTPVEATEYVETLPAPADASGRAWLWNSALFVAGCGLLVLGADRLVAGAIHIAETAGVSQVTIGLTIVAAGTSLPELAASAVASFRGRDDIAVANIIGSNIFNILGILGVTAAIHPLPIPEAVIARDDWWMIGFALVLLPFMHTSSRVVRLEGAALLAGFAVYLGFLLG